MEEIAKHDTEYDAWTVVYNKVYNISRFLKIHPGGKKILRAAGKDGTELFKEFCKGVEIEETVVYCFFEGYLKEGEGE